MSKAKFTIDAVINDKRLSNEGMKFVPFFVDGNKRISATAFLDDIREQNSVARGDGIDFTADGKNLAADVIKGMNIYRAAVLASHLAKVHEAGVTRLIVDIITNERASIAVSNVDELTESIRELKSKVRSIEKTIQFARARIETVYLLESGERADYADDITNDEKFIKEQAIKRAAINVKLEALKEKLKSARAEETEAVAEIVSKTKFAQD